MTCSVLHKCVFGFTISLAPAYLLSACGPRVAERLQSKQPAAQGDLLERVQPSWQFRRLERRTSSLERIDHKHECTTKLTVECKRERAVAPAATSCTADGTSCSPSGSSSASCAASRWTAFLLLLLLAALRSHDGHADLAGARVLPFECRASRRASVAARRYSLHPPVSPRHHYHPPPQPSSTPHPARRLRRKLLRKAG